MRSIIISFFCLLLAVTSTAKAGFQIWDFEDAKRNKEWKDEVVGEKIEITNTSLEGDARLVCRGQLTSSAWDY